MKKHGFALLLVLSFSLSTGCLPADDPGMDSSDIVMCGQFKNKALSYGVYLGNQCVNEDGTLAGSDGHFPAGQNALTTHNASRIFDLSADEVAEDGTWCASISHQTLSIATGAVCTSLGYVLRPMVFVAMIETEADNHRPIPLRCTTSTYNRAARTLDFVSDTSKDQNLDIFDSSTFCQPWKVVN